RRARGPGGRTDRRGAANTPCPAGRADRAHLRYAARRAGGEVRRDSRPDPLPQARRNSSRPDRPAARKPARPGDEADRAGRDCRRVVPERVDAATDGRGAPRCGRVVEIIARPDHGVGRGGLGAGCLWGVSIQPLTGDGSMIRCEYACQSDDHALGRRAFLGAAAAGAAGLFGLGSFAAPAAARDLARSGKRVLTIFLSGGVSQLEPWDPKPGTDTGGPLRATPTSVPGVHICELLPQTAKQMHRMVLVRGINTAEDEHGRGATIMLTGRRPEPGFEYPHIGAVAAKLLGTGTEDLPGHIQIHPGGGGGFNKQDAAFLGPRFASVVLGDGKPPADLSRPAGLTTEADRQRDALLQKLNE